MATALPLQGLRVLDITRFISGPFCTMMLGDLGADVIKVEHPVGGDSTRRWGSGPHPADNPYFMSVNRNKRSVAIDLKKPQGIALIESLLARCDVLVNNSLYGALAEFGLGDERLVEINPRLIYCEITAYGVTGPDRDRGAMDFTIQAESGLMSLNGEPEGTPMKVGAPLMDVLTGLFACNAIQAALLERERTGRGGKVGTSMLEVALASMPNIVSDYLVDGIVPDRWGNGHPNLAPYEIYKASDRWTAVGIATEPQWAKFCDFINRADLRDDPRFVTNQNRTANRAALIEALSPIIVARPQAYWLEHLSAMGMPCAPVNTVPDILAGPQVEALGLVRQVAHPLYGQVPLVRSAISRDGEPLPVRRSPPTLGEHTDEVLVEVLELSRSSIDALRQAGAVTGGAAR